MNQNGICTITAIIFISISLVQAALYPYGPTNGDKILQSNFVQFTIDPIRFLGSGTIDGLWVNNGGSLTYRTLQDTRFDELKDNAAICPYFAQPDSSSNATIYYRQVKDNNILFDTIAQDVQTADLLPELPNAKSLQKDFIPTWALVVTWENLVSPDDATKTNTFQLTLASDGETTYAIYNYENAMEWWLADSNYAAAGLFITEGGSYCSVELEGSESENVKDIHKKSNVPGKLGRFVMVISEPFLCQTSFKTSCGDLPNEDERWGSTNPYFANNQDEDLGWQFFALFTCDNGFYISEGVKSQKITCRYDGDYYEDIWDLGDGSKCIDMNATRQFDIRSLAAKINSDDIEWTPAMADPQSDVYSQLEEIAQDAFKSVLADSGVVDVSIQLVNVRNRTVNNSSVVELEMSVKMPPYIQKKLNGTQLQEHIDNALGRNNVHESMEFKNFTDVTEKTTECLQSCLCRNRKSIELCPRNSQRNFETDACCGGCNGKPYASGIKACCVDIIYDPKHSICCGGRIRKKNKVNIRKCFD